MGWCSQNEKKMLTQWSKIQVQSILLEIYMLIISPTFNDMNKETKKKFF